MFGNLLLFLVLVGLLLVIWLFTPSSPSKNTPITEETSNWEYQKEQAKKESTAERNKEWFKAGRWLTDKEIDWATERMEKNQKFKILPAHQFHLAKEAKKEDDPLIFKELLKEINDESKELVFILVNNPNFHWSLLVYETSTKQFYHYDTLRGANWNYVKDLVYELLAELKIPKHLWGQHFLARHKIRQKNGWECGICAVGIMRRIRDKYQGKMENIQFDQFGSDYKFLLASFKF